MKDSNTTTEKTANRPLFPELETGVCMLAFYLHEYIQSIRRLEKRPAPATR